MPLINRVGGSVGSKAPMTGYITPTNTDSKSVVKITSIRKDMLKVKFLVLYAIDKESVSAGGNTIISMLHAFDDTSMDYVGTNGIVLQAKTLATNYAYENVQVMVPSTDAIVITRNEDYIEISVNRDNYHTMFNASLKYAYTLFY